MPAVPVSELWQAIQFCLKNGFTYCSNDASRGATSAAAWASRKRAVTPIPATESKVKTNTDCSRIRYLECTDRISNPNTIPLNYASRRHLPSQFEAVLPRSTPGPYNH